MHFIVCPRVKCHCFNPLLEETEGEMIYTQAHFFQYVVWQPFLKYLELKIVILTRIEYPVISNKLCIEVCSPGYLKILGQDQPLWPSG